MVQRGSSTKQFLPHALAATFVVIVLPALAVSAIDTSGRTWVVLLSVLLAMGLSVASASVGCALWTRWTGSRDLVLADLMLWGWLRRVRAERRLARVQDLVEAGTPGVQLLQRLARLLEAKDVRTLGHTRRVTRHAERIARVLGLSSEEVAQVRTAASVHDVGKVHTPSRILVKPGALTSSEFAVMKRHPVEGAEMVVALGMPVITAMVRHHHERLDGSGYPNGLRGEEIPLGARIIAVADTFDAMTSSRPYRDARTHQQALDVLAEEAGVRLDAEAVAAFQSYYSDTRSVAWSALGLTGPPRLGGWLAGLANGAGGWGASLGQGLAGFGAVALIGVSLGGEAAPAAPQPSPAGARTELTSASERTAAQPTEPEPASTGERPQRGNAELGSGDRSSTGAPRGGAPLPGVAIPVSSSPSAEQPGPRPLAVELPEAAPQAGLPEVELPVTDLPAVELPPVDLPAVELPPVETPPVELPAVPQAPLDTDGLLR